MKKGILTFIFLSLFLVNLNIVKAVSCEDLKLKIKYGSYNSDGYYDYYLRPTTMQLSDGSYRYPQFDMVDDAGTVFSSFCRNPNANVCDNKGNTFVCNSEVFEPNEAEIKKTYDAGILAILRGGYSHNNPPTAALTKSLTDTYGADAGYSATSLALRVYEMLWISNSNGKANNNIKNGNRPYNVNKNYTILWRDGEDADEYETRIINAANQINSSYLIPAGYYKGTNLLSVRSWTYNGKNIKDPVEKAAKELIALGLEAALDYQKNGVATLTWNETPVDKIESQETLEDGSITYKRSHTYNFKLEKFDADDAIAKINSITCTNCSSYNVDYTVYVNDEEVGKTFPIDLKAKKDSNNQVKIKIEFTGNTKNYDCSKIDYKINIGYYDDTISTQAFNVTAYGQEKNIDCQEFYLLNAVGVEREAQIANNVKLCNKPTTCKDLEKECTEDHDEDACEEWEDKYEKDCSSQGCTTFVSDSTCKIDASQINIKEGYELGENVCETPENLNVLSCIIDKKDKAGNSYKATNLVDNKYCSVFCKEDYHIELPGDREVNSGRYFSLKASIGGTKTCYSNKIDKETFEIDFKEANQAIITAYNNYQFYNAVVNGKSGGAENRTGATLGTHSHPCGQTCRKPA